MKLAAALTLVARIAKAKQTPILGAVKIDGDGRILANDTALQLDIPCDFPPSLSMHEFCVHAARLAGVVKALPKDAVLNLTLKENRLTLTAGATRYELNTLPAEDFPALVTVDDATGYPVQARPLADALRFVAPAMASADIRYYLNGMHFAIAGTTLTLTATDGHRLHRSSLQIDADPATAAHGILPRDAIPILLDLLDEDELATLSLTPERFALTNNRSESLAVKLVDGKFPDSDRVIPASRTATGALAGEPLIDTIKRVVVILAGNKYHGVRVTMQSDRIIVSAENTEGERATERIAWTAADPKFTELTSGYDSAYLIEALAAFATDTVNLHIPANDSESLYLTDTGAGRQQAVIMPMRL